jgi:hypothetical protein
MSDKKSASPAARRLARLKSTSTVAAFTATEGFSEDVERYFTRTGNETESEACWMKTILLAQRGASPKRTSTNVFFARAESGSAPQEEMKMRPKAARAEDIARIRSLT